jgi:hypothetical protein
MWISRAFSTSALLLAASISEASFWISEFTGQPADYRLERGDTTMRPAQLMLLQAGDVIFVDDEEGRIVLLNERNERIALTRIQSPFRVPESREPPGLLANIGNWVVGWWNTRASQSSVTVSAVSRGELDPTLLVAAPVGSRLLAGTRAIRVTWQGGSPPFSVQIKSVAGELLAESQNVPDYAVTLPGCLLPEGTELELLIRGAVGESTTRISVVSDAELPLSAQSVIDLDVPDEIRFGHMALLLSGYANWRFEAQQLAHTYELRELEQRLLDGGWPDAPPREFDPPPANDD